MSRLRALAGACALGLALSGCAPTPPSGPVASPTPGIPSPTTVAPAPSPTASPAPPGWTVETWSNNDPALPVHLQWPVVPGATALNAMLAEDMDARARAFLADSVPNPEVPPELSGTWETVLDAPAWAGVRVDLYEFAGASGRASTSVLYGEKLSGTALRSVDLLAPTARRTAVDAVVAALRADGHEVLDDLADAPDLETRLFDDVVVGPRGELVVRVGEGLVLPFSEGVVDVTLAPSVAEGVLSEQGRDLRDAVVGLVGPASPTPTPAAPVSPRPAASVDCAVVACVALTFDDGPGKETGRLLDDLAAAGAPATVFVLGTSVRAHPDLVRRMAAEGHEVGTHTWSHKQLTKLGEEGQRREVQRGVRAVEEAGVTPTVFRPPYGSYNATTRKVVGAPMILWDVDTLDWKTRSTDATVASAVGDARAGSIVLMHDIHAPTVDAVPRVVAGLRERGFTLVTVSQLLGPQEPGSVSSRRP